MTKIVARRKDDQIVMLPKPEETTWPRPGDIRFYRKQYQEYRKPGVVSYYWRDVTDEVAAVVRQTFAPAAATLNGRKPTPEAA